MREMPIIMTEIGRRNLGGLTVTFIVILAGMLLLYYVLRSLKTGRVWLYSKFFQRYICRETEPGLFWLLISIYTLIVTALAYGGVHGVLRMDSLDYTTIIDFAEPLPIGLASGR